MCLRRVCCNKCGRIHDDNGEWCYKRSRICFISFEMSHSRNIELSNLAMGYIVHTDSYLQSIHNRNGDLHENIQSIILFLNQLNICESKIDSGAKTSVLFNLTSSNVRRHNLIAQLSTMSNDPTQVLQEIAGYMNYLLSDHTPPTPTATAHSLNHPSAIAYFQRTDRIMPLHSAFPQDIPYDFYPMPHTHSAFLPYHLFDLALF